MNNKNKIHPFIQIRILLFFLLNGKKQIDEMQIFLNIKQKSMKFSKLMSKFWYFYSTSVGSSDSEFTRRHSVE